MLRKSTFVVFLALFFLLSTPCVDAAKKLNRKKKLKELIVETEYMPNKCDVKTEVGDKLAIHYTGYLLDGHQFDSSRAKKEPFEFQLGLGSVIKGWDQGLEGMCIGEKRKLTIPSELGYGDSGVPGSIPARATLVFDTQLINIKRSGREL